ncbi:MAG TPA: efflux RND transporter periplasmic adaptor subunit [Acetobacteraceae bacterium]|nr:efflux RND transporter periplasmic adaptor subunit [Acetobacteraceae bacterium]
MGTALRLFVLVAIGAAAFGGYTWYERQQAGQASPARAAQPAIAPPVPVLTEAVQRGAVPVEILANGIVTSEAVITVRTRVDGQIEQVHVQEGQMVRRGQPLFTLDSRLNRALLAQQEAQLARDRALQQRAQSDLVRYQALRGEGFAAQQRFEQAQADALAAAATVRATEALIAQTRLSIEFATIVAETDGRLGALPLRVGNVVRQAENTAMATVTQTDPILVQFQVPERWLNMIKAAMSGPPEQAPRVRVQIGDDAAAVAEGMLVFVDSAVDTQTGTIALRARFENPDLRLWPGQYVQVRMVPRVEENAITVPSAALQTGQGGRFVMVVQDGVARRRAVELVRTSGARVVLAGALEPGERVITDGAQRVTDGSRVVERNRPSPAAPGGSQRVSSTR